MKQRTVLCIARLAEDCFSYGTVIDSQHRHVELVDGFADLLFEHEIGHIAIEYARKQPRSFGAIKNFVLTLWSNHLGYWPSDVGADAEANRERRMLALAAVLEYSSRSREKTFVHVDARKREALLACLDVDGYRLESGLLIRREENAFDVEEQEVLLLEMYERLNLAESEQVRRDLRDIDDHYVAEKWGDSIKHARDLIEVTLRSVLTGYSAIKRVSVALNASTQPRVVRDTLLEIGFWQESEKKFVAALYGLLSDQGGHPNLSPKENARICRQYALSAVHFVLLRYERLNQSVP